MTPEAFEGVCSNVLGDLCRTIDPWRCSGAHAGIDRCRESGPDHVKLLAARKRAADIARTQAADEPWFVEGPRWHRGCLTAIDRVLWHVESTLQRIR